LLKTDPDCTLENLASDFREAIMPLFANPQDWIIERHVTIYCRYFFVFRHKKHLLRFSIKQLETGKAVQTHGAHAVITLTGSTRTLVKNALYKILEAQGFDPKQIGKPGVVL